MRDYVINGEGFGPVGGALSGLRSRFTGSFDSGILRPFFESDPNSPDVGRPCAEMIVGAVYNKATGDYVPQRKKKRIEQWNAEGVYSPVFNSVVFSRQDWIHIDRAVQMAQRLPLTAFADLRAASVMTGFDAWSKLTVEYSAMSDAGEVVKDMDATSPGRDDTPLELIRSTPLPVLHSDFSYPQRLLDAARASGMPLDTTMFEQGTRRIWESVERGLIGLDVGLTWGSRSTGPFPITGTSTEYGYVTYPLVISKTDLTTPTGSNPEAVNQDVMEMVETLRGYGFFGPFILYYSTPYGPFINGDYFRTGGTATVTTLKQRLMLNSEVADVRRLDALTTGYKLILVDLNSGHVQAIDGMKPKPVQWSERAGYIQKFMVLAIQTQIFKTQYSGVAPVVYAVTTP